MIPNLDGITFDTSCGQWKATYLVKPDRSADRNNYTCIVQFQLVAPNNQCDNEPTEWQLRIDFFGEEMAFADSEQRFLNALGLFIESPTSAPPARFRYESGLEELR